MLFLITRSNKLYIKALVSSLREKLNEIDWKPDLVVASYHGIPKNILKKGILIIVIVKKPQDSLLKVFMRSQ